MRPRYKFGLCFGQPRTELLAENEAPQSINQRPIVSFFSVLSFLLFFKKAEQTFFLIPLEAERRLRDKNLLLGPTEVRFIFLSSVTGGSFVDDSDLTTTQNL